MMTAPRPPLSTPNAAARSLLAFGVYLALTGALLLLAPALLLAPLALPVPGDVWIRVVGVLALALAATDIVAAREGLQAPIRLSVWRRGIAALVLLMLVITGTGPAALVLFAAVDAAAAAWTAIALRAQRVPTPAALSRA